MVVPLTCSFNACLEPASMKQKRGRSLLLMGLSQVVRYPCFAVFIIAVMLWPSGSRTCRTVMWLNVVRPWTTVAAQGIPGTGEAELPDIPSPDGAYGNMQVFLNSISARVKHIAEKAKENHARRCDVLQDCKMGTNRSRLACGYRKEDKYSCYGNYSFDESICSFDEIPGRKNCTQLNIIFDQTFVRYPLLDNEIRPMVDRTLAEITCAQFNLHDTFQRCLNPTEFDHAGGVYFGSVSGIHWGLPGMNQFKTGGDLPYNCREKNVRDHIYDPRHRPWYKEASSPRKQVSVLVDLSNAIGAGFISGGAPVGRRPRIEVIKDTLQELAKTFRNDDEVFVTTFPPCFVSKQEMFTERDPLKNFPQIVKDMRPVDIQQDLADGINCSIAQLESIRKSGYKQILLVFTRGRVDVDKAISHIKDYNNRTTGRLFVFFYGVDIVQDDLVFSNISKIASGVNGLAQTLGCGDPLLAIYSYFDFLASFYRNERTPWLCDKYEDAFNLKNITTSVLPVYDDDGHFIGVACMDIRNKIQAAVVLANASLQQKPEENDIINVQTAINVSNSTSDLCYDRMPLRPCPSDMIRVSLTDVLYPSDDAPRTSEIICCDCLTGEKIPLLNKWWFRPVILVVGTLFLATVIASACQIYKHYKCCSCHRGGEHNPQPVKSAGTVQLPAGKY